MTIPPGTRARDSASSILLPQMRDGSRCLMTFLPLPLMYMQDPNAPIKSTKCFTTSLQLVYTRA